MTCDTLHIELTFAYQPFCTNCLALQFVSSLTYYFLLLRVSMFINTVFRELHFNCSSFTAFVCEWWGVRLVTFCYEFTHWIHLKIILYLGSILFTCTLFLLKNRPSEIHVYVLNC